MAWRTGARAARLCLERLARAPLLARAVSLRDVAAPAATLLLFVLSARRGGCGTEARIGGKGVVSTGECGHFNGAENGLPPWVQ